MRAIHQWEIYCVVASTGSKIMYIAVMKDYMAIMKEGNNYIVLQGSI